MNPGLKKILEGKHALRQRLARLPMVEKLQILDRLREREIAIRGNSPFRLPRPNPRGTK